MTYNREVSDAENQVRQDIKTARRLEREQKAAERKEKARQRDEAARIKRDTRARKKAEAEQAAKAKAEADRLARAKRNQDELAKHCEGLTLIASCVSRRDALEICRTGSRDNRGVCYIMRLLNPPTDYVCDRIYNVYADSKKYLRVVFRAESSGNGFDHLCAKLRKMAQEFAALEARTPDFMR